ncbi:MAG: hypothetical protein UW15_C0026G0001, partial [Parcubacteria group bacterium GW2011_GWC1_44_10]
KAGDDQAALVGLVVTLIGKGSTDGGSGPLTYKWEQIGETPEKVTLSSTTVAEPTFMPKTLGVYEFKLTVTNKAVKSAIDNVKIFVVGTPDFGKDGCALLQSCLL